MRAWLILLAVLATFQTIVQVASTEDTISSRFITAISPTRLAQPPPDLAATKLTTAIATTALATTTAAFNPVIVDSSSANNANTDSATSAASAFSYKNSDSDNKINKHNNNKNSEIKDTDNVIIEIKNIEEIEGNEVHEIEKDLLTKSDSEERADQKMAAKEQTHTTDLQPHHQQHHHHHHHQHQHQHHHNDEHHHHHHQHEQQQQQQQHHHHHEQQHHRELHHHHHQHQHESTTSIPISQSVRHHEEHDEHDELEHQQSSSPADANAMTFADENDEPATYSNREIINEKVKPDPSTLVQIENSLLSLFNMKRPPKIDRSKIVIPEAMKKLYAQIMGHELDSVNIPKPGLLTKSANTVRSFTHQDSKIDDRFPHHHRFRLYFEIKSIPAEEKLKAAELQLTRDAISHAVLHPRLANRTRYQVLVYDITRVGVKGKREPSYLLLDNKTIRLNSTETVSLDVQPAVNRWLATPKKNFGLLVEVRTSRSLKPAPHRHVRLRRSADETHEHWQHKQPLLFTYTDDGRHKSRSIRDVSTRSKRAGHHRRPHRRKNKEEICRRQSLYVDFTDVGWNDWIVAPPGYDAFYCHGKCPFPLAEHLNSTNHAVVQTLVNNLNPEKVPKACCVPTQLEGISMLYLNDQSTVVLKNYQDMTVVGCGCR